MTVKRIAMWSGPRNISTAMMRSWENRHDTMVVDEPLYGPYLFKSHKKHPMWSEIIADQGEQQQPIIERLIKKPLKTGKTIFYQKHMCHHIFADDDISWIQSLYNMFLIRDPKQVLASYLKKHDEVTPDDLGYPQQLRLFEAVKIQQDTEPVVIDSQRFLKNPQTLLKTMCQRLGVAFNDNMLSWPKGYRDSDGVWAPHWYNRVIESNGFAPYQEKAIELDAPLQSVVDQCQPYYEALLKHAL